MAELSLNSLYLLLDVSLKSLLLWGVAALSLKLLRIRDSNLKHRIWSGVLIGMLALPLLSSVLPAIPLPFALDAEWFASTPPPGSFHEPGSFHATDNPPESLVAGDNHLEPHPVPAPSDPGASVQPNEFRTPDDRFHAEQFQAGRLPGAPNAQTEAQPEIIESELSQEAEPTSASVPAAAAYSSVWSDLVARIPQIALGGWLTITAFFLLRLAIGLWATSRLRMHSPLIDRTLLESRCAELAPIMRSRQFGVRECAHLRVPVTAGWLRPTVFLPAEWRDWPPARLRVILVHETTHVARRDYIVAVLAELNRGLYWFHPVAWWLRRQLANLAEKACDDAAIGHTGDPAGYAGHLLEVASNLSTGRGRLVNPGMPMARESNVETRITAILDFTRPLSRRLTWKTAAAITVICIPVIALAAALQPGSSTDEPSEPPEAVAATDEDSAQNPTADAAETIGNEEAAKQSPEVEQGFRIHGQVVDNDKHGIPKARVRLYRLQHRTWYASDRQAALVHEFQLDNEGRFDHRIPLDAFPEDERQTLFDRPGTDVLVVDAPGYVYATRTFADHSEQPPAQKVRLWKEVPVRGRILDPEGQPVENATISISGLNRSDRDKIGDWMANVSFDPPKEPLNMRKMMSVPGALQKSRFPAKRNIQLPSVASAAATTNDKGEFELHGIGPDDLALINIQGEGIAKTTLHVLNRETPRFYAQHHSNLSVFGAYYGRVFDFVAQPSVPFFGVVRDIDTKEPLANVTVAAGSVYGTQMSHEGYIVTTTDQNGRYRLEGLPIPPTGRGGNRLAVRPYPLPYIENDWFAVPAGNGVDPVEFDIEMKRAVLAKGRLTDPLTGKPVQAKFYYAPFLTNEHVSEYSRYADGVTTMLGNDSRYYTDEEGYFEIPVIPGRGVIAAKCLEGKYRTSFGAADIPEFDEEKQNIGQLALSDHIIPSLYHSLLEVNPSKDVAEIEIEMRVDSGKSLPVRFLDPNGNPLSGVRVIGLNGPRSWKDIKADHAEITGLGLGEIRPLRVYHRERKLSRLIRLIPEKGQKELKITLLPATVVSGRFIDPDGNPIEGVRLDANHNLDPDFMNSEGMTEGTAADGKFEIPLPVGATYYVSGIKADGTQITVAKDLKVTKPQTIDLGDLVVDPEGKRWAEVTAKRQPIVTDRKPEKPPKSDKKPATEADDSSSADAKDQTPRAPATSTRFWGSLLDEDGNAVSGARVRLYRTRESPWPARRPASTLIAEFKLDANGQFDREFAIDDLFPGTERTQTTNDSLVLVASAPGYAWETTTRTSGYLKYMKPESIVFTLKKEMPIEGRIVDLEGQPIPGARVRVFDIMHSKSEKLDDWISNAATAAPISGKKERMMRRMAGASPSENELYPRERNLNLPAELTQEIVTDENGRFVVERIAPDDLVQLVVEGREIAKVMLDVVAREMKTVYAPKRGPLYLYGAHYGSQFTCIAQPSVSVTGVIRDIETKAPLADIEVTAYGQYGDSLSLTGFHLTKTDSSGRYRFEGLPVNSSPDADERNRLSVFPYPLPYIELDWLPMPAGDGVNPVEFDVELRRAVMVKGRLTNKVTGEPVWARMYYSPFNTNPHLSEYKRYADQTSSLLGNETRYVTDEKGYFEIPVIPGRGVVGARSWDTTVRPAYGANEIEEFADERKEGRVTSDYLSPSWYHSLIEVNPAEDDTEINVEMQIDPGLSLTVNFVDERGRPLAGVVCDGLQTHRRIPVAEDHAQVLGLAAGEVRWLDARHKQRKLARMFRLVPEEGQEEITVQLLPMTIVSGRLVDQYGSPVSDVVLESRHQNDPDFGGVLTPRQRTDRDGRFEYELPIGASSCRLFGFKDKYFTIFKDHDVTMPQEIDLGDLVVDPDAKQWAEVTAKRKPIVTERKPEESTETGKEPPPALEESTAPANPAIRSSTKSNSRNDRTEPLVFSGNRFAQDNITA